MKCFYCGKELNDDALFCPYCGKKVEMVPEYSVYDDDFLKEVLAEENQAQQQAGETTPEGGEENPDGPENPENPEDAEELEKTEAEKKKMKTMYIVFGCIIAAVVVVVIVLFVMLNRNTENSESFDYQVQMAEEAYAEGDMNSAIEYYKNALILDSSNEEIRLILAQIYYDRGDYDSAEDMCLEILKKDSANADACELLIQIYEIQKDYDAIVDLYDEVDESLSDLFAAYVVTEPEFSLEEGTYSEYQTLTLSTSGDYEIYYTTDGSDPTLRGTRYTDPIELNTNAMTYTIMAVCMNDKGIYGDVATRSYTINLSAPDMPIVTPDGGDFGVETTVTVTVPDGCSAYYTWDGTDPSTGSSKYDGPITVPEGNNILSVIIVDNSTNLSSSVYRGNFIYYVEEEEPEDADDTDTDADASIDDTDSAEEDAE